jgi:hypothetical protein
MSIFMRQLFGLRRVLTETGVFLSVTFAQPHFRRRFLLASGYIWGMQVATFGEGFHYFVYTMRKGARSEADVAELPDHSARVKSLGGITESPLHEHMESEDYLLRMDIGCD